MSWKTLPARRKYTCDRCSKQWIVDDTEESPGGSVDLKTRRLVNGEDGVDYPERRRHEADLCMECAIGMDAGFVKFMGARYAKEKEKAEAAMREGRAPSLESTSPRCGGCGLFVDESVEECPHCGVQWE